MTFPGNNLEHGIKGLMVDISIIMPCFNSAKYLDDAVRSVVNQSFESWELLICDDGSTDQSLEIAEKWSNNHR